MFRHKDFKPPVPPEMWVKFNRETPSNWHEDNAAVRWAKIEFQAKLWDYRTLVSVDLKGGGYFIRTASTLLGKGGGEILFKQLSSLIEEACITARAGDDEGLWKWGGDGGLLVFHTAGRAHDFAVALHQKALERNSAVPDQKHHWLFRTGLASTDNPERESWDASTVRAVRLESKADVGGILADVQSWCDLPSSKCDEYGPKEDIPGKPGETPTPAHRYPKRSFGAALSD